MRPLSCNLHPFRTGISIMLLNSAPSRPLFFVAPFAILPQRDRLGVPAKRENERIWHQIDFASGRLRAHDGVGRNRERARVCHDTFHWGRMRMPRHTPRPASHEPAGWDAGWDGAP